MTSQSGDMGDSDTNNQADGRRGPNWFWVHSLEAVPGVAERMLRGLRDSGYTGNLEDMRLMISRDGEGPDSFITFESDSDINGQIRRALGSDSRQCLDSKSNSSVAQEASGALPASLNPLSHGQNLSGAQPSVPDPVSPQHQAASTGCQTLIQNQQQHVVQQQAQQIQQLTQQITGILQLLQQQHQRIEWLEQQQQRYQSQRRGRGRRQRRH